jgi:hypothetical protein
MCDNADANCFLNSAKYMMRGKVLYNDFFEQKGPIIYFLHMVALTIIPDSFHGIYLIEVLCAVLYCHFVYKSISLFSPFSETKNVIITTIACVSSYVTGYMEHGDEIEEFCLPIFAFLIYHVLKYILDHEQISKLAIFICGIFAGLIFWSKYTILAPYCAIALYCIGYSIKYKDFKNLKNVFLYSVLGFLLVTALMAVYFIATDSFSNMIDVYFIENIVGYRNTESLSENKLVAIILFFMRNIEYMRFGLLYTIMFGCMFFCEVNRKFDGKPKKAFAFLTYSYFATWFATALCGGGWNYYYMHHSVYFGLIATLFLYWCQTKGFKHAFVVIETASIIAGTILLMFEMSLKQYNADQKIYKDIAKIVDNKSVLVMNFLDTGFYFTTNNLPDKYYFTVTNARQVIAFQSMCDSIRSSSTDYVIVHSNLSSDALFDQFDEYGYRLCYTGETEGIILYLYELIPNYK